jgi:hypothetical protein
MPRTQSPFNPKATFWRGTDLKSEVAWVLSEDNGSWRACKQAHIDWMMGNRRWLPITEKMWWYWLEVLYPEPYWQDDLFLSSEMWSGNLYPAGWKDSDGRFWFCYVSVKEAKSGFARTGIPRDYSMPVILEKEEVVDIRRAALEAVATAARQSSTLLSLALEKLEPSASDETESQKD